MWCAASCGRVSARDFLPLDTTAEILFGQTEKIYWICGNQMCVYSAARCHFTRILPGVALKWDDVTFATAVIVATGGHYRMLKLQMSADYWKCAVFLWLWHWAVPSSLSNIFSRQTFGTKLVEAFCWTTDPHITEFEGEFSHKNSNTETEKYLILKCVFSKIWLTRY